MTQYYSDSVCPVCKVELGYHDEDQADICWSQMKSEDQKKSAISALKSLGDLSHSFGTQRFDALNEVVVLYNPDAWFDADKWLGSDSKGLYLHGEPGTGKTHAARCILNQALDDGLPVMEISAHKMIRCGQRFDSESTMKRIASVDILLIDDIDKAIWNDKSIAILWELLNDRDDRGCRTIITTNVPSDKFRVIFADGHSGNGSVIESMIQRLHPIKTIAFNGISVRGMV
jgi:DNA replication protein DnaC